MINFRVDITDVSSYVVDQILEINVQLQYSI